MTNVSVKSNAIMVIMASSPRRSLGVTVRRNGSQSFTGGGAQHQNARAERAIQAIMYMAQMFMVHATLHWTERGLDDLSLSGPLQ